ncbi:class I glutamine amidotransferase (macronuclear) [Tetrahymena thermophila SB210]|uniref:folate gamma-glutamyl hydrolase n=1 Tax=Tetrahymena thermophila (strain SB210) TaxID=312017 RepID=Q238Z5_TETTS|nr:class I glutamine amidotransferase [Tetrahymena thermophila SB210]EAR93075.3 class I glutamine amidotransferase [Tetrahymena thermophila SB210]|eukprot:XP_001013320.3 class I glutamine amidotransferase [Tetrahymena thermophila SB210]
MQKRLLAIFLTITLAVCLNNKPIIGIYTQPSDYQLYPGSNYSYIAASYVKYLEGAGAQAVVIPYDATFEYIDNLFEKINGVLFPGGSVEFEVSNPGDQERVFLKNAVYIVQKAKNATDNGDYFPIWGTCMGFQLLTFIGSGFNSSSLVERQSDKGSHNINITDKNSNMFRHMPEQLAQHAQTEPALYYSHSTYVPLSAFTSQKLSSNFKITSTATYTPENYTFVNSIESIKYPMYGIQFHPEKNIYEWKVAAPHDYESEQVAQYFANFFVNQTRQNYHSFNGSDFNNYSIYQYPAVQLSDSSFVQVYIIPNFNKTAQTNSTTNSTSPSSEKEKFLSY